MEWLSSFLSSLDPTGSLVLILIAAGLGAFVGLRREIQMQQQGIPGFVGLRTMALITVLGAVMAILPDSELLILAGFLAILGFVLIAYYNGVFQLQLLGVTSELSTLLMYFVGVLVGFDQIPLAVVLTVMISIFTAFKIQMHDFARAISPREWSGALQLLIISAIVLPLLPNTAVDPFGVLVPQSLWMVVILISAIGFVGYFLQKYLGRKHSVLLTAALGSLVSSTAITTHISQQVKRYSYHDDIDQDIKTYVTGISIAITVMLARVFVVLLFLAPMGYGFGILIIPSAMIVAAAACVAYYLFHQRDETPQSVSDAKQEIDAANIQLSSPFDLIPALQFAGVLVIVLYAIYFGNAYFGTGGVIATTFFSAFADVDAAILSVLQTYESGLLGIETVTLVILVALVVNTMVKALYAWILSRNTLYSLQVLATTSLVSLAGLLTYLSKIFI